MVLSHTLFPFGKKREQFFLQAERSRHRERLLLLAISTQDKTVSWFALIPAGK